MEIGEKIRRIRTDNNLSQEEFAGKFHVTRQAVSNWEHGRNYPDMNTISKISDEFDVSFDELIKGDEELIDIIDTTRKTAGMLKKVLIFMLACIIGIALSYVLPKAVKKLYYDPGEVIYKTYYDDYAVDEDRLTSDIQVYSTLRMPGHKYDNANSYEMGMGKYGFTVSQSARPSVTEDRSFSGRIERNTLQIFEPDKFKLPYGNVFEWSTGSRDISKSLEENLKEEREMFKEDNEDDVVILPLTQGMGGTTDESKTNLRELDKDNYYEAYISFDRAMSYEDAIKWIDKYEDGEFFFPWVAVATSRDLQRGPIGFYTSFSGYIHGFDKEKYPYLFGYADASDINDEYELRDKEDIAKLHIVSMLKYMRDQKTFNRMLYDAGLEANFSFDDIDNTIEFIEEHGLHIYGVAVTAKKDDLIKVHEDGKVFSIATEAY